MRFFIALGFPISVLTLSVCNTECDPVISLLSKCGLPALRNNFDRVGATRQGRNVTGLDSEYGLSGPSTYFVESLKQSQCLCTEGNQKLEDCKKCLLEDWEANDGDVANPVISGEYNMTALFREDCISFGYYLNTTAGHPTTTRTSPPKTTRTPDIKLSSHAPEERFCKDVLGFVEGQIDDCGLVPIEADSEPQVQYFGGNGETWSATVIFNRTASECVCTLPVLRRLKAASLCTDDNAAFVVREYRLDCNGFGYWVDNKPVRPPSKTSNPSPSSTSSGSSRFDAGFLNGFLAGIGFVLFLFIE